MSDVINFLSPFFSFFRCIAAPAYCSSIDVVVRGNRVLVCKLSRAVESDSASTSVFGCIDTCVGWCEFVDLKHVVLAIDPKSKLAKMPHRTAVL